MQTSLRRIAKKARRDKKHRFRDLYGMLNEGLLLDCWRYLNKRAASGVDRVTAREYERNLEGNVRELVERLKGKRYRAKLVRRVYIPKSNGRKRPLGIPALEDKIVQLAAARILTAIYEEDFLPVSFGYRPRVGPRAAVRDVTDTLQWGKYSYVVEADIRGFFDNIDHEWMIRMLEQRIDDRAFMRLVTKWLKAGILERDGQVIHPVTGTPQGGIISPVLANIYLHYALDLWFEKVVKRHCCGEAYICRYADDFISAFRYKRDAGRFQRVLSKRLGKFGLELSEEKTRVVSFSRFRKEEKTSFEFLGFEFRWGVSRRGKDIIKRRTSRKRLRMSLKNLKRWCREKRNVRLERLFEELNSKLRGYYNYYGIIGNYKSIKEFFLRGLRILFKWLNRRSQTLSFNYREFFNALKRYGIERPRITERCENQLKLSLT